MDDDDLTEECPEGPVILHVYPTSEGHDLLHNHDCWCEPIPHWREPGVIFVHRFREGQPCPTAS